MTTPLDPAFGALLAHANLNLLSLGLPQLDIELLGEQSPATPIPGTDAGERGANPDCTRCGGRGFIVVFDGSIDCPVCAAAPEPRDLDTRLDARGKEEVWWGGGWRSPCCLPADAACLWVQRKGRIET